MGILCLSLAASLGVASVVSRPVDIRTRPADHPSMLYDVKVPAAAKPWERTAARELDAYLARLVTNRVTVAGETHPLFHVGDTDFARAKGLGASAFADEEWCVRSFGRDVVLAGGGTRGTLYAVSHFLEDDCGVRWWSEFEESVPAARALDLPALDRRGRPAFAMRDIFDTSKTPATPGFDVFKRRLNGTGGGVPSMDWGGSVRFGPPDGVHTFCRYTAGQFKAHPEWKAKPTAKAVYGQLCLSAPGLREFLTKKLFEYVDQGEREAREKGLPAPQLYDLSINDDKAVCACAACKAEQEKYGVSGQYLNFLNPIAEELAARHPGLKLTTLAYFFTEDPPKGGVKASDNLVIRLCDTRTNQAASHFAKGNTLFIDLISGWRKVAKHILIWDYMVTFNGTTTMELPYPSEFHLADYLRKARASGVMGFFVEHEYRHSADMYELKSWVEAKLFENPDLDETELIRTFLDGYYGPAAEPILRFRRELDETCRAKGGHVSWMPSPGSFAFIDATFLKRALALFDEAERSVKDDPLRLSRVRRARLGVDRLLTMRRGLVTHEPGKGVTVSDDTAATAAARRILDVMPKWMEPYADKAKWLADVTNGLEAVAAAAATPTPGAVAEFADRTYYDFPAWNLKWRQRDKDWPMLGDDAKSVLGKAVIIKVERNEHFRPPFAAGAWNAAEEKILKAAKFDREPIGDGYRWFNLGEVTLPADGFVYITSYWMPQAHPSVFPELVGKPFDIWISARFEGPLYRPGTTGPDRIFIDRVLFVKPRP